MPTLNIEGHRVRVDDSFLKLSPDEQNATVEEIASSLIPEQTGRKGEFDDLIPAPSWRDIPAAALSAAHTYAIAL